MSMGKDIRKSVVSETKNSFPITAHHPAAFAPAPRLQLHSPCRSASPNFFRASSLACTRAVLADPPLPQLNTSPCTTMAAITKLSVSERNCSHSHPQLSQPSSVSRFVRNVVGCWPAKSALSRQPPCQPVKSSSYLPSYSDMSTKYGLMCSLKNLSTTV